MAQATIMNGVDTRLIPEGFEPGFLDGLLAAAGSEPGSLIPLLQAIQARYHYLPAAALRYLCANSAIHPADAAGVATFYGQFRHRPAGRHRVKVCVGTACHVLGGETVYQAFRDQLHLAPDEDTDAEKLFTVEKVACLGCCMLAPAVQIDDVTYGPVTVAKVSGVLQDFLAGQALLSSQSEQPAGRPVHLAGEVRLCQCSSCQAAGAASLRDRLQETAVRHSLPVRIKPVGCNGRAYLAPALEIVVAGRSFHYGRVKSDDAGGILLRHFRPVSAGKRLRARLEQLLEEFYTDEARDPVIRYALDMRSGAEAAFGACQCRVATECQGELDPLDLDEYIARGGFQALHGIIGRQEPAAVTGQIMASGLRGRGGAGFPTGRKWQAVAAAPGNRKYVIGNGDEGDPGAFMDRMIMESFPYRVVEGMILAGYATGAGEGVLYIRAEYPLALERIRHAISVCGERGFLGRNIIGRGFNFQLRVAAGAGAFVCGEETALIAAIEGRRGTPRLRPPYPAESGLYGCPTLVNNVETLALIPALLRDGNQRFTGLGTANSPGTKTFALAGSVVRSGLIEVPMGMTLRQIVEEIGGGVPPGHTLKAIQVGGPSGGCVPAGLAGTPVDFEALQAAGAMMGSGGMVVLDDTACMVDLARYFMSFTQQESCGRCTFCRVGTKLMLELLERLCRGEGRTGDLEKLEELAIRVQEGSLCGLGRTAPNPVLSTLRHFRPEYEAHLQGRCPAGRCRGLIRFQIGERCIGCTRCAQRCPAGAIAFLPYERHSIDASRCTRCGACLLACPAGAVTVGDHDSLSA